MSQFRKSLYVERQNIRTYSLKVIDDQQDKNERDEAGNYEKLLDKTYMDLLEFYNKNFFGSDDLKEHQHLQQWHERMRERKKLHRRIGFKQNREAGVLVMNSAEDRRTEQELKALLEYAQYLDPPDKYRGHPSFWMAPDLMHARCTCAPIASTRRPLQEGVMPEMEHVSVPETIRLLEKGIIGESSVRAHWAKSKYLRQRMKELASNIAYVKEYYPDTGLFVQGKGYARHVRESRAAKALEEVPRFVLETVEDVDEDLRHQKADPETGRPPPLPLDEGEGPPLAQLSVGGVVLAREVVREEKGRPPVPAYEASGPLRCSLDVVAPVGLRSTALLRLENLGRSTVRVRWAQLRGPGEEPEGGGLRAQRFFVPERDVVCPPGQVVCVPVFFFSDTPGVFRELWELLFEPRLTPPERRFLVRLWGMAEDVGNDVSEKAPGLLGRASTKALLAHVDACAARAQTAMAIHELAGPRLRHVPTPPPFRFMYLENEVFEHRNPGYHHTFDNVDKLKNIFQEATGEPPTEWDLSLQTLKQILLQQTEDLDRQQKMLAELTETTRDMMEPMSVPSELTRVGAHSAAYIALCCFAQALEREALLLHDIYMPRPDSGQARVPRDPSNATTRRASMTSLSTIDGGGAPATRVPSSHAPLTIGASAYDQYLAALFVRVYHLLGEAVERVVAAVAAPGLLRCDEPTPAPRDVWWRKENCKL